MSTFSLIGIAFITQVEMGFDFTLLDIGGGFPGAPDAAITFEEVRMK